MDGNVDGLVYQFVKTKALRTIDMEGLVASETTGPNHGTGENLR